MTEPVIEPASELELEAEPEAEAAIEPKGPGTRIPYDTIAIAFYSGLFLAFAAFDAGGMLKPLVLPYLVLVPGLAIMRASGIGSSASVLSLALVVSVAVDGAVATILVSLGRLEPSFAAMIIVTVVLAAMLADEILRPRRTRVDVAPGRLEPGTGAGAQR